MLKTLNNLEIRAMVDLKDFIEIAMSGLEEIEILNLSVDDIIEIYNLDFSSDEEFALYYAKTKSESRLFSYIGRNLVTNKVDIKEEFKVNMNDVTKMSLFFSLLKDYYSIDDAKAIINDIEGTLFKYSCYKQAQEQLNLYNLAIRYAKKANLKIHSIINLYKMF